MSANLSEILKRIDPRSAVMLSAAAENAKVQSDHAMDLCKEHGYLVTDDVMNLMFTCFILCHLEGTKDVCLTLRDMNTLPDEVRDLAGSIIKHCDGAAEGIGAVKAKS